MYFVNSFFFLFMSLLELFLFNLEVFVLVIYYVFIIFLIQKRHYFDHYLINWLYAQLHYFLNLSQVLLFPVFHYWSN